MTAVSTAQVRVVTLTDECDIGVLPWLRSELDAALADRPGLLVVDLAECSLLDAQAVPVLVEASREMSERSGLMLLRGGSPQVARLLALADPDGELRLQSA